MSDTDAVVVFEPLHTDVKPPSRTTDGAAGYDVRAYLKGRRVQLRKGTTGERSEVIPDGDRLELAAGDVALIPTGFKARVPDGFEAQIRIRSSMAFKRGLVLPNAPGTVDADYPDEWLVMVMNTSAHTAAIEHGERIAQIVLNRFEVAPWIEGTVGISTDRLGGFGSTGTG